MSHEWYESTAEERVTQGQIVWDCPVLEWADGAMASMEALSLAVKRDVIVMTQACDLANDKVLNVIVCPHVSLKDYQRDYAKDLETKQQQFKDKNWRSHCNQIVNGRLWNLSMLNSSDVAEVQFDHRVVYLHDVYSIPRTFLEAFIKNQAKPKVFLRPPYREYLSQAFARFFMRVGLPMPITKVWEPATG
jgi:hypothetical protein